MRRKLDDLFIYHTNLDSRQTIDLLISFEKGRLGYIRRFIDKSNVNSSIGVCGFLPLELAIIYDHKHIFDYLIFELKANLNIKNKSFDTMPFVALAFQRRNYLFDLLNLDTSTLYDCTSENQRTLMHEAAINGDAETVKRLINDFGFYKNLNEFELSHLLYDKYECTPLYYACWFGCIEIVELLLNCTYSGGCSVVAGAGSYCSNANKLIGRDSSNSRSLNVSSANRSNESLDENMEVEVGYQANIETTNIDVQSGLIDATCLDDKSNDENSNDQSPFFTLSTLTSSSSAEKRLNLLTNNKKVNLSHLMNIKPKAIKFDDSSLAISILNKRFDCTKMLLNRCLEYSLIQTNMNEATNYSTELDSWLTASMKIYCCSDFIEMCNIFHELVLNGAKFSNYIFIVIDSINDLTQFNQYIPQDYPAPQQQQQQQQHQQRINVQRRQAAERAQQLGPINQLNNNNNNNNHNNRYLNLNLNLIDLDANELLNYCFNYNNYCSYFLKSLTFICNYNLEKLFTSESKCELFLKSCFIKINELFLINNNWHIIDHILINNIDSILNGSNSSHSSTDSSTNSSNLSRSAFEDYFNFNRDSIEWFLFDLEQFLKALYKNGFAFKYFSNKKFFNFLRKRKFIYYLIESCLYSHSYSSPSTSNSPNQSSSHTNPASSLSSSLSSSSPIYSFGNNSQMKKLNLIGYNLYYHYYNYYYYNLSLNAVKADAKRQSDTKKSPNSGNNNLFIVYVGPLSLSNLAKLKINSSLKYLDTKLINKLQLPKQLLHFLSADLANGLLNSFERSKMNKKFCLEKKSF